MMDTPAGAWDSKQDFGVRETDAWHFRDKGRLEKVQVAYTQAMDCGSMDLPRLVRVDSLVKATARPGMYCMHSDCSYYGMQDIRPLSARCTADQCCMELTQSERYNYYMAVVRSDLLRSSRPAPDLRGKLGRAVDAGTVVDSTLVRMCMSPSAYLPGAAA
jgi:hypothetical protein